MHIEGVGERFLRKAKAKVVKEQKTCYMYGGALGNGSFKGVVVVEVWLLGTAAPLSPL
jgi:hypothetical protein